MLIFNTHHTTTCDLLIFIVVELSASTSDQATEFLSTLAESFLAVLLSVSICELWQNLIQITSFSLFKDVTCRDKFHSLETFHNVFKMLIDIEGFAIIILETFFD